MPRASFFPGLGYRAVELEDNSLRGIYSEHCLEHIPVEKCRDNLREFFRILQPGGIDGEAVESSRDVARIIRSLRPGDEVEILLERAGATQRIGVRLDVRN